MCISKRYKKLKHCGIVSPVEIAVQCNRDVWLNSLLGQYKLSGNIITNDGRHILGIALKNCSLNVIKLLLEKGSITRVIEDNTQNINFIMDGVLAQACCKSYRQLNLNALATPLSKKETPLLSDYEEYLKKGSDLGCNCHDAHYFTSGIKMITEEEEKKYNKIAEDIKQRIEILKKAEDHYFSTVGLQKIEYKRFTGISPAKGVQNKGELIFPLQCIEYIIDELAKFPGISAFASKIM